MFRGKWLNDGTERVYGFAARIFGVDVSLSVLGWINDWRIIDLRVPCNYGIYFQLGFALLTVGRLPDESIYGRP